MAVRSNMALPCILSKVVTATVSSPTSEKNKIPNEINDQHSILRDAAFLFIAWATNFYYIVVT